MAHHHQHRQQGWYVTSDYPNDYVVCTDERKPACQDILVADATADASAINHNRYHQTYGGCGNYGDYQIKPVPRISDHQKGRVKEHIHFEEDVDATIGTTAYGCGSTYAYGEPQRGRRVKENVYFEEEVDAEADEFIELKHKNFERSKMMSMKGRF